jgi:phage N-6-adenine-methyltransferase
MWAVNEEQTRGTTGTGENEWFTPKQYIKLARDVLGTIDLDPASSEKAQKVVKAEKYFTKDDSGLENEWKGRVWLNPPYAQPLISEFVTKLITEVSVGRVSEAILLTHNYTDTSWFHQAAGISSAICFTRGRIQFYNAQGEIAAPTQGQAFFYYGRNVKKFVKVFSDTGFISKFIME